MKRTTEYYSVRMHQLEQRDAAVNKRIINKLARKVRELESNNNKGHE